MVSAYRRGRPPGAALLAFATAQPVAAIEDKNIAFEGTEDLYRVCSVEAADPSYAAAQVACTAFIEATVPSTLTATLVTGPFMPDPCRHELLAGGRIERLAIDSDVAYSQTALGLPTTGVLGHALTMWQSNAL